MEQQSVLSKSFDELIVDPRCRARERMNGETVEEYADLYRAGETLPPLEVFEVKGEAVIVDGFHRHEAAIRAGVATLPVKLVGRGSMSDAAWYALGTNKRHGLKRTRADKRKVVDMALARDDARSDREIARHVGVSHTLVSKMRKGEQLKIPAVQADPEELRQSADEDFQSGNFAQAKVGYEKAIAASQAQYTPLRIELERGPRLCVERLAPPKRARRIKSGEGRPCTLCGLEGSISLQLFWTMVDFCAGCLDVMQETARQADHEPAQQMDHAEAAE